MANYTRINHGLLIPLILILVVLLTGNQSTSAQTGEMAEITQFCPIDTLQPRGTDFTGSGVILTAFDGRATWHFDVATGRRYPLPETAPCGRNCHLSPDGAQMVYFNDATNAFNTMSLDGSNRVFLTTGATDVLWWEDDVFFIWTPGTNAFILRGTEPSDVPVNDVISVQSGGKWGITSRFDGAVFQRSLVEIERRTRPETPLGEDRPYFNAYGWSPDGGTLAYVALVATGTAEDDPTSAELFLVSITERLPQQMTDFTSNYGITRINGIAVDSLSWSPDSQNVAFWVLPMPTETVPTPAATIHMVNRETGAVTAFCGLETMDTTPNTPQLIWSPDGQYLAFAADPEENLQGALLLALEVRTGLFTILSDGVYAAYGLPDVYLWGS